MGVGKREKKARHRRIEILECQWEECGLEEWGGGQDHLGERSSETRFRLGTTKQDDVRRPHMRREINRLGQILRRDSREIDCESMKIIGLGVNIKDKRKKRKAFGGQS